MKTWIENKKGFTLIEMLVVILIIVILITIAVPAVSGYRKQAQETADLGAAKVAFTALEAATIKQPAHSLDQDSNGMLGGAATVDYSSDPPQLKIDKTSYGDDPFSQDVVSHLGANFKGQFRFAFDKNYGSIKWVVYLREGASGREAVMVYNPSEDYSGYIQDLIDDGIISSTHATFFDIPHNYGLIGDQEYKPYTP